MLTSFASRVCYQIPETTHGHKSMLLRGVRLPKPVLDRGDIENLKRTLESSGRSYGGAPLGNNGFGRGRRGDRISYAPRGVHSNGYVGGGQHYQSPQDTPPFSQPPYNQQRQSFYPPPPPLSFQQQQPWIPPPPGHPNFGMGMPPPPPPPQSYPYDGHQWGAPGIPPGSSRSTGRPDWQSQPPRRGQHRGGARGRDGSNDPRR